MKMLRCEMEVMDVIDEMLMADEELMAEIEADIYDELDSSDNFESESDYEDYIVSCMYWDYTSHENTTIIDILNKYHYKYTIEPSTAYWARCNNDIVVKAIDNEDIHLLRQFGWDTAIWIKRTQEPARDYFEYKDIQFIIDYED